MADKKIRITLEITIDPQQWADEYGVPISEVKEDAFILCPRNKHSTRFTTLTSLLVRPVSPSRSMPN